MGDCPRSAAGRQQRRRGRGVAKSVPAECQRRTLEFVHATGGGVRDDGIGFAVAAAREKAVLGASLGLLSMQERAVLGGGGLEFTSGPNQGTEVHAWFPLKWRSE